jgi:DNA-directed RNA polymerase II subunit RPB2
MGPYETAIDTDSYGTDGIYDVNDDDINQADAWAVIGAYFASKKLVRQQIDSFNVFMSCAMADIVEDDGKIKFSPENQYTSDKVVDSYTFEINFDEVQIADPQVEEADGEIRHLYPHEARLRSLTYTCSLYCNVFAAQYLANSRNEDGTSEPIKNWETPLQFLGYVPVMLRSQYCILHNKYDADLIKVGECLFDQGGYFIINGGEKVIIAQERMSNNHVYVFRKKQPSKYEWVSEIKSQVTRSSRIPSALKMQMYTAGMAESIDGHQIRATLPYIREDIPVAVIFRALGFTSDRALLEHIVYDFADVEMMERFRPSLEEGSPIETELSALDYIGRRGSAQGVGREERVQYARHILQSEVLPHVAVEAGQETKKAFFVGYIVHKMLMCSIGRLEEDDRDHLGKKRLDLAGPLMTSQFRFLFLKLIKNAQAHLAKSLYEGKEFSIVRSIKSDEMTNGLKRALATGNWGTDKTVKPGVSQVLSRLTYASALSHLRRCNAPLAKEGKIAQPRMLHCTHWGMICPAETPEGSSVGLVKNLALMAVVSVGSSPDNILSTLGEWMMENLEEITCQDIAHHSTTKVFVDGNWVGIHREPDLLVGILKNMRRRCDIEEEVSIVRDIRMRELRVYTDYGRLCRPLFTVENKKLLMKRSHIEKLRSDEDYNWDCLLAEGVIEYIDCEEEETCMIAMKPSDCDDGGYSSTYTHCEIHPAMILGICASIIPFPDHNQSPRNTYQSAMGKQAMGIYSSNFQVRMDTMAHTLHYPQKPLATTRAMEWMNFRELPSGINCIVAIACYTGYNQEDSLIMNQSSIDRGLFRSSFFRCYSSVADNKEDERFENPSEIEGCVGIKTGGYDQLGDDGTVDVGTLVSRSDVLIGKTCKIAIAGPGGVANTMNRKDASTRMRSNEDGIVDRVLITTNKDGNRFCKVRIRNLRIPQCGDKFASRHGQKGTIGMTYRQEDMPYSCEGIAPDVIVNPHAIPSRMTVGHLIECLMGKLSSLLGDEGDATPFIQGITVETISHYLHNERDQKHGNECLYSGHTGRPLDNLIFFGPTFYQRLKHLVEDKIHARARGPVTNLTRQPMEGRGREGGLRMGEMERDCLVSHGAANFLRDRLYGCSDPYRVHVCDDCGMLAIANLKQQEFSCRYCGNHTRFSQVHIPYAGKLLFQELMSMCITPRIFTAASEIE